MCHYIILITLVSIGIQPVSQTVADPTSQVVWEYSDDEIAEHQVNRFELRIDSGAWQSVGLPLTASGEYQVAIPPTSPGDHVLDLRACNSELCGPSASVVFSLEDSQPPANTPFAVSVDPTAAQPGSPIVVSWSAPDTRSEHDWVAIYPAGGDSSNYTEGLWAYTDGTATGSVTLAAPAAGAYDVRYLLNDGYEAVASVLLEVVDAPTPPLAPLARQNPPITQLPDFRFMQSRRR
jgi:hypothetical protein